MALNEQDEDKLLRLFEELDELTGAAFREAKVEVDGRLAARFGIEPEQLRPWHYDDPFFQEAPRIEDVRLDTLYADRDLVEISRDFYRGIGLGSTTCSSAAAYTNRKARARTPSASISTARATCAF